MKTVFEKDVPPPARREYKLRLTPKLKEMQQGDSVVVKKETARCLAAYIRRREGQPRTHKLGDGMTRVWFE